MLLLDLPLRPVSAFGPEALPRLAAQLGLEGICVGPGSATLAELEALLPAALKAGAPIRVLGGPLAPAPLPAHKRLPSLCGEEADERLAAVALVEGLAEKARTFGIALLELSFGAVPLAVEAAAFRRAFDRRAWREEGGFGFGATSETALGPEAFGERQGRSSRLLDAARFSLERLTVLAGRHGVTMALAVAATPWEFPGPREALALAHELRGAPLTLIWDPARLSVLHTLGLGQSPSRLAELAAASGMARLHDAVGVEVGYLPGLGVPSPAAVSAVGPPLRAPWVLNGRPDTTELEVAETVAALLRDRASRKEAEEKAAQERAAAVTRAETSARG